MALVFQKVRSQSSIYTKPTSGWKKCKNQCQSATSRSAVEINSARQEVQRGGIFEHDQPSMSHL